MIRLTIVEDHTLFREGIKNLLQKIPDFQIVGEYSNGSEFLTSYKAEETDIILMDIEMPVMNGIEASKECLRINKNAKIIVLSMYSDKHYYYEMILAGVSGFIIKDASVDQLEKAIREVHAGFTFFSPELIRKAMSASGNVSEMAKKIEELDISKREVEVLKFICAGHSNNEISEKLFISPRTVESHRNKLLQKTESKNTASLIIYAIKNKLVEV